MPIVRLTQAVKKASLGDKIRVQADCAEGLCGEQCPTERDMLEGVEYAGMATIAELACESTVYTF